MRVMARTVLAPAASGRRPCAAALAFCLVAAALAGGCGKRDDPAGEGATSPILCLPAMASDRGREAVKALREAFPSAERLSEEEWIPLVDGMGPPYRLLVVADAQTLSRSSWRVLRDYSRRGGRILYCGRRPFADGVHRLNGRYVNNRQWRQAIAMSAETVPGFSDTAIWRREHTAAGMPEALRIIRESGVPWPSVRVSVSPGDTRHGMRWSPEEEVAFPEGANALLFYARSYGRPATLEITLDYGGGERHRTERNLEERWGLVLVPLRSPDGLMEAAALADVRIGLSRDAQEKPGALPSFGLSAVRVGRLWASDIDSADTVLGRWAPFADPAKHRELWISRATLRSLEASGVEPLGDPLYVTSCSAGPTGAGGAGDRPFRWIPVVTGYGSSGRIGWPLALYEIPVPGRGLSARVARLGVGGDSLARPEVQTWIKQVVDLLQAPALLAYGGMPTWVAHPQTPLQSEARASGETSQALPVRFAVELLSPEGRILRRAVSRGLDIRSAVTASHTVALGTLPYQQKARQPYRLRTILEGTRPGRHEVFDWVDQPLWSYLEQSEPDPEEWVTASQSGLRRGRRSIYALGIQMRPPDVGGAWLDPGMFDADRLARALDSVKAMGAAVVTATLEREDQLPALRALIAFAEERGMWIWIHLPALNPLGDTWDMALDWLDRLALDRHPSVLALEVARDPVLDLGARRTETAWRAWLREQYGSWDHAAAVLQHDLWQTTNGPGLPPIDAVRDPAPEEEALTRSFFCFADDLMSRRAGALTRRVRNRLEAPVLLTWRAALPWPDRPAEDGAVLVSPAAGVSHFDILTLSAARIGTQEQRAYEAGFPAAVVRGFSGGKPVVWSGFAPPAGASTDSLRRKSYRLGFDLAHRSAAAGAIGCCAMAGVGRGDGGGSAVLDPGGTPYAIADVYHEAANQARGDRVAPRQWSGREVDLFAHPRGFRGLWATWRSVAAKEMESGQMEEVRVIGQATRTTRLPLRTLGGAPYEGPAPIPWVNGEWGRVRVNGTWTPRIPGEAVEVPLGSNLTLELVNTGPSTWVGSEPGERQTVWVWSDHPRRRAKRLPVPDLPSHETAVLDWVAADPGVWTLQPRLSGAGVFGELLRIRVVEN